MAYIGHNASGNFTTKPSKDTFSGDGSTTAFTLSEGATTNTVDVFVENVRQEPTTAYSVDGTTLTFTAAPRFWNKQHLCSKPWAATVKCYDPAFRLLRHQQELLLAT